MEMPGKWSKSERHRLENVELHPRSDSGCLPSGTSPMFHYDKRLLLMGAWIHSVIPSTHCHHTPFYLGIYAYALKKKGRGML